MQNLFVESAAVCSDITSSYGTYAVSDLLDQIQELPFSDDFKKWVGDDWPNRHQVTFETVEDLHEWAVEKEGDIARKTKFEIPDDEKLSKILYTFTEKGEQELYGLAKESDGARIFKEM